FSHQWSDLERAAAGKRPASAHLFLITGNQGPAGTVDVRARSPRGDVRSGWPPILALPGNAPAQRRRPGLHPGDSSARHLRKHGQRMTAVIGPAALLAGLVAAALGVVAGFLAGRDNDARLLAVARNATWMVAGCLILASGALIA